MKKLLIPIVLLATGVVTGCSGGWFPGVYKIDVQQGNVVEQEDLNKVKPNMSRRQVRFLLGTPLVQDPFHQQRWDYVYTFKPGGEKMRMKRVTLFFENDKLARIEGDMRPQAAAANASEPASESVSVEGGKKEKGFFKRMLEKIGIGDD